MLKKSPCQQNHTLFIPLTVSRLPRCLIGCIVFEKQLVMCFVGAYWEPIKRFFVITVSDAKHCDGRFVDIATSAGIIRHQFVTCVYVQSFAGYKHSELLLQSSKTFLFVLG